MTIRREPVSYEDGTFKAINQFTFWSQCIADLAEGKHAVGCKCASMVGGGKLANACTTIAQCARDLEAYELSEGP